MHLIYSYYFLNNIGNSLLAITCDTMHAYEKQSNSAGHMTHIIDQMNDLVDIVTNL